VKFEDRRRPGRQWGEENVLRKHQGLGLTDILGHFYIHTAPPKSI